MKDQRPKLPCSADSSRNVPGRSPHSWWYRPVAVRPSAWTRAWTEITRAPASAAAGFRAAADAGARVISVHARVQADGLTATGLYHQLCGERPGTFLLESAEHGSFGRWSFIGVNALGTLSASRGQATWEGRPLAGLPLDLDPLAALATTLTELHTEPEPGYPPFVSGFMGYLGYDVVRRLERLPDTCILYT